MGAGIYLLVTVVTCICVLQSTTVEGQNANNNYGQNINPQLLTLLPELTKVFTGGGQGDVVAAARTLLTSGFAVAVANSNYSVSSTCLEHTELFLNGLLSGERWALQMLDAMGKPASGIMTGNLAWLGSYDECVSVEAVENKTALTNPYHGQYCKASYSVAQFVQGSLPLAAYVQLQIGICFPSSCSTEDTVALSNTLISLIPGVNSTNLPIPQMTCQKESLELSTKAIAVIAVCCIFATVLVCGTAYDICIRLINYQRSKRCQETPNDKYVYTNPVMENDLSEHPEKTDLANGTNGKVSTGKVLVVDNADMDSKATPEYTPGTVGKALLSFSVYTNALKILSTSQPAGSLSAVNGIRFLSMTWVIIGHTMGIPPTFSINMTSYYSIVMKRLTFDAIRNATFSVDSFFVLSGLLVSYLSLKEMKKVGGALKFRWGLYYFHRVWRLTPPYMLVLMLYVPLFKYWSNGPLWSQKGIELNECSDSWWQNILYINNLYDKDKTCMAWSWYLANDMQFFILSPLMIVPLYYSSILGTISCLVFVLISVISSGLISKHYELPPDVTSQPASPDYLDVLYSKPWCRIGPYAVGMFLGFVLYKTKCKVHIPKIVNAVCWLTATAVALVTLYGLHTDDAYPTKTLSVNVSAVYNATSRTAWGISLAWVIFACATGYGGPVNTLLSWSPFIPLGRLTYCAYLIHIVIIEAAILSRHTFIYLYDLQMIYLILGTIAMSYGCAFVVSLAFEAPMMGLEKALLGRGKNS